MDVAGEDRAVGAVLDLDPVGGDVDRRIAVVALERRDRLLLRTAPVAALDAARAGSSSCKDDANGAHQPSSDRPLHDFQASAAIEDHGSVAKIGLELPGLELAEPHLRPTTGPALASLRCFRSTVTSRVASR